MQVGSAAVDDGPSGDWLAVQTFDALYSAASEGLIYVDVGGPPSSTWSGLCFLPRGPRPLRSRWTPWGLQALGGDGRRRVAELNTLLMARLSTSEAVATRRDAYVLGHTSDNRDPSAPSFFVLPEVLALERAAGGGQFHLGQCAVGAETGKPTTLSAHTMCFSGVPPRCPGLSQLHRHARDGALSEGGARFTEGLCEYPARGIVACLTSLGRSRSEPEEAFEARAPCQTSERSTRDAGGQDSLAVLNESCARDERVVLQDRTPPSTFTLMTEC